jgi:hypothetical protein
VTEPCDGCKAIGQRLAALESAFNERRIAVDQRFRDFERSVDVASQSLSEWRVHTNEFRSTIDRQANTFLTIEDYNRAHRDLAEKQTQDIRLVENRMAAGDQAREVIRGEVIELKTAAESRAGRVNIAYLFSGAALLVTLIDLGFRVMGPK